MTPRDPRREPEGPGKMRESSSRFELDEAPSYSRSQEHARDSQMNLPSAELMEQYRQLGFRQGESEVGKLRATFDEHCKEEKTWQREVDRKLDRACDGIDRITRENGEIRDTFSREQKELGDVVQQHEQYVQQAKGAAFATKLMWLLIGGLISALVWVFTHLSQVPVVKASEAQPYTVKPAETQPYRYEPPPAAIGSPVALPSAKQK